MEHSEEFPMFSMRSLAESLESINRNSAQFLEAITSFPTHNYQLKCNICGISLFDFTSLLMHISTEHRCSYCGVVTRNHSRHEEKFHKSENLARLQCKHCTFLCDNFFEMRQHEAAVHGKLFQCPMNDQCYFQSVCSKEVDEHIRKHSEENQLDCQLKMQITRARLRRRLRGNANPYSRHLMTRQPISQEISLCTREDGMDKDGKLHLGMEEGPLFKRDVIPSLVEAADFMTEKLRIQQDLIMRAGSKMKPILQHFLRDPKMGPNIKKLNKKINLPLILWETQLHSKLVSNLKDQLTQKGVANLPCSEENFHEHILECFDTSIIAEQESNISEAYWITYKIFKLMGASLLENQVHESLQALEYLWHNARVAMLSWNIIPED